VINEFITFLFFKWIQIFHFDINWFVLKMFSSIKLWSQDFLCSTHLQFVPDVICSWVILYYFQKLATSWSDVQKPYKWKPQFILKINIVLRYNVHNTVKKFLLFNKSLVKFMVQSYIIFQLQLILLLLKIQFFKSIQRES
jgi:hypothetical protein